MFASNFDQGEVPWVRKRGEIKVSVKFIAVSHFSVKKKFHFFLLIFFYLGGIKDFKSYSMLHVLEDLILILLPFLTYSRNFF